MLQTIGLFRLERQELYSVLFSSMDRAEVALFLDYWHSRIRTPSPPRPHSMKFKEVKFYLERRRERVGLGDYW